MARQPLEDREYEVHPSQLRWAMHNMAAAGYPPLGYAPGPGGNTYIIIVQQPAGSPPLDWQAQPRRRNDDGLLRLTIVLGAVILVGAALWLCYTLLTGAGVRIPWQGAAGEPVVTTTGPAGWSLPNPLQGAQDAAQATQDAANAVSDAVAMLFRLGLAALALGGLYLLRGILGPLVRGAADLVRQAVRR